MSKSQEHKQKLFSQLNVCEKVKRTVASRGWKEILGPKLQKMIESVTGQRDEDGLYVRGLIDTDKELTQFYLGYKAALMDFNNEVYNHLTATERIKDSLKTLGDAEGKEGTFTKPMEDTRYAS
jgi:hypothetical protein